MPLGAVALLGRWAADQGGYAVSRWAPGTTGVLVLLGVALVLVPNTWGDVPRPVRIATGGLAAFTAWSFLSLLWADDRGAAWEGSQRTLLYLAVFALFALWPQRGRTAVLLVAGWTLAVQAVAVVLLVRMGAAGDPRSFFGDDRLADPAGYPNATARRVRRAGELAAGVAVVVLVAGGLAVTGNPVDRLNSAYDSFKGGYESTDDSSSRLVGGLGSNRYGFYRVALREFADHPVAGIGADKLTIVAERIRRHYGRDGTVVFPPRRRRAPPRRPARAAGRRRRAVPRLRPGRPVQERRRRGAGLRAAGPPARRRRRGARPRARQGARRPAHDVRRARRRRRARAALRDLAGPALPRAGGLRDRPGRGAGRRPAGRRPRRRRAARHGRRRRLGRALRRPVGRRAVRGDAAARDGRGDDLPAHGRGLRDGHRARAAARAARRGGHRQPHLPRPAVMAVLASPTIELLFGEEFRDASTAFAILMGLFAISGFGYLSGYLVLLLGLQKRFFVIALVGLVVNVGLNVLLLPRHGFEAAAVVTIITDLVVVGWSLHTSLRVLEMRPAVGRLARLVVASLAAGLAAAVVDAAGLGLAPAVAAAVVVYVALVLGTRAWTVPEVRAILARDF